jgi:hypothetical protein
MKRGIWTEKMFIETWTGRHFGVSRRIPPRMLWGRLAGLADTDLQTFHALIEARIGAGGRVGAR